SAERQLRSREEIDANVRAQMRIFRRILDFSESTPNRARILNNADWLGRISFLDALRDVGKHFSVNTMIQRDAVRDRLHNRDQGISYTEFSYIILQSYDFLVLHRDFASLGLPGPVTVQCGGSDQWGNMVGGIDLIRRVRAAAGHTNDRTNNPAQADHPAFCLTAPLVTKADGGKFGKSESGAIWLTAKESDADTSPNRTSAYAFYQFWLNTADADVGRFLRTFTFLDVAEIESLEAAHAADPAKRLAQKRLAEEVTRIVHGEDELAKARQATASLFGGTKTGEDAPFVLPEDIVAAAPSSEHSIALLEGTGVSLVDVLATTTLAKSKTEARTLLTQNSISVNGHKAALDARLSRATLLPGNLIALRRGGKTWHITRWK
ncbi:MAG: tyrosine--tRNA ligase, partial [Phycisphaeraceae bacterium]|nr:tyrosine--tRNA ligase [Phycisphaeraceae bacterium]